MWNSIEKAYQLVREEFDGGLEALARLQMFCAFTVVVLIPSVAIGAATSMMGLLGLACLMAAVTYNLGFCMAPYQLATDRKKRLEALSTAVEQEHKRLMEEMDAEFRKLPKLPTRKPGPMEIKHYYESMGYPPDADPGYILPGYNATLTKHYGTPSPQQPGWGDGIRKEEAMREARMRGFLS